MGLGKQTRDLADAQPGTPTMDHRWQFEQSRTTSSRRVLLSLASCDNGSVSQLRHLCRSRSHPQCCRRRLLQLRPEDVSEIHTIHTECVNCTLRGRYSDEQIAAWLSGRTPEGYLRACASGEHFFVAEQENAVIGFASWQDDELLALFVHPNAQAKGVGTALLVASQEMPPLKGMSSKS
jgi:hypothetical protein